MSIAPSNAHPGEGAASHHRDPQTVAPEKAGRMVRPSHLAWSLLALQLMLVGVSLAFSVPNWSTPVDFDLRIGVLFLLLILAFALVGALLAARRPSNPVGWCFSAIAGIMAVGAAADSYGVYALATAPGSVPGGSTSAWFASVTQGLLFVGPLALMFLTFPAGNLPSRRWRRVVWMIAGATVLLLIYDMFGKEELNASVALRNPYRVAYLGAELAFVGPIGIVLLFGALVLGLVALALRFRSARGVERQQLKWLAYSAGVITVTMICAPIFWFDAFGAQHLWPFLFFSALSLVPISAGIAILRYRLFDIDLIINRTLVYGSLVALLGAAYVGTVFVLQALLTSLASGSDLAIAGSTLAVAALFRPFRGRIQRAVDQRFYRRKYDAEWTIGAFRTSLRDEIDLDTLTTDVARVVYESVQPRFVGLWLAPRRNERISPQ